MKGVSVLCITKMHGKIASGVMSTLKKTLDVLKDFFMSGAIEIDPHILQVSRGRYTSKRKLSDEAKRALELANEENTLWKQQ